MLPDKRRLLAAMSAYGMLALMAAFTLQGMFRVVVWIFLGAFAAKTWIAALRQD